MKKIILFTLFIVHFTCGFSQTIVFDFNIDEQGFESGVSDFNIAQSEQHEFTFENRALQVPLDTIRNGQYISGINPSD